MAPTSNRSRLIRLSGVVTVLFLVLTSIIVGLAWVNQKNLRQQNYDDSGLSAIQIRLHYLTLLGELKGLETAPDQYSVSEAVLQYNILYERLKSLPTRPPYPFLLDAEVNRLLVDVFDEFSFYAPDFDLAEDNPGSGVLVGLYDPFSTFRPTIERISSRTTQLASAYRGFKRERNVDNAVWLIVAVVGLIISSGLFAVLLWLSVRSEAARATELASARDEAIRANQAKTEFLAHMSHDLRTPLNAIIGFSDMIRNQSFGSLHDKYVEYATDVKTAGEQLLHLIGELLDLSRIEAQRMTLHQEPFQLAGLLDECTDIVAFRSQENLIKIDVHDKTDGIVILADIGKTRQMVLNLLDNALKFSHEGGQILVAATVVTDGGVAITVHDHGKGILGEDLHRVLEPFAQIAMQESTVATAGVGLGLPIVKAIIELHGGHIEIESEPIQGTSVTLVFPSSCVIDNVVFGA